MIEIASRNRSAQPAESHQESERNSEQIERKKQDDPPIACARLRPDQPVTQSRQRPYMFEKFFSHDFTGHRIERLIEGRVARSILRAIATAIPLNSPAA